MGDCVLVRPWLVGPMVGRGVWFHDSLDCWALLEFHNTCNSYVVFFLTITNSSIEYYNVGIL